jgi:hypothetical protein
VTFRNSKAERMGMATAILDLYRLVPSFFLWFIPTLVAGYVAFLWSGYALGKWMHQAEIAGLKSANDAVKSQNDALKTQNDISKERIALVEDRFKLAKEQADDAKRKMEELKAETAELRAKAERNEPVANLVAAAAHADIKAANVLAANNAVSSILQPVVYSTHTRIEVTGPAAPER